MRRSRGLQRLAASIVAVSFCYISIVATPIQAAMVGTSDILQMQSDDLARDKVHLFLQRRDVVNCLEAMGVDARDALDRVNAMTDEEVRLLSDQIDQMPAGGDGLGFILGVAVVTFIVLIILDIIGVTDVFTFIKKR